jgi:hypothetical protein
MATSNPLAIRSASFCSFGWDNLGGIWPGKIHGRAAAALARPFRAVVVFAEAVLRVRDFVFVFAIIETLPGRNEALE